MKRKRHDWAWKKPKPGMRQCQSCGLEVTTQQHIKVGVCIAKPDNPLARIVSEDGTSGVATGANKPAGNRLLTKAEMLAINNAQPPEAKYGDAFEAIANKIRKQERRRIFRKISTFETVAQLIEYIKKQIEALNMERK